MKGRSIESETRLITAANFRIDVKKKQVAPWVKLGAGVAVLGAVIGFSACSNNQEDTSFPFSTGVENNWTPEPFFNFSPPSERRSCFDTFQYIYEHFNSDGYLIVNGNGRKYIIAAPVTFSGSGNLGIYLDKKVSDKDFFEIEVPLLKGRLRSWFERAGVDLSEAQVRFSLGNIGPDGIPRSFDGAPTAILGSKNSGCLFRPSDLH